LRYSDSILDLVGHTPLVRLHKVTAGLKPTILAKLEQLNPGGSVKDRIGLTMIEEAERTGQLRPGGTIIEPTSGNTGHGLAMVAAIKGYKMVFVMPDKMSAEKISLLRAYGADVVVCPTNVERESPQSYYSVAERLSHEIPGAFQPNQYFNQRNPEAHYRTTGPEVWEQTEGRVDVFVSGMGTGGTISGVARYLKEKKPSVQIVGADPIGSIYSSEQVSIYSAQQAQLDHLKNPEVVRVTVQIFLTDSYGPLIAHPTGSDPHSLKGFSERPADFWRDFHIRTFQKEQLVIPASAKGDPTYRCDDTSCLLSGATLTFEYPAFAFTDTSATIQIDPPEGEPVVVDFDLTSFR